MTSLTQAISSASSSSSSALPNTQGTSYISEGFRRFQELPDEVQYLVSSFTPGGLYRISRATHAIYLSQLNQKQIVNNFKHVFGESLIRDILASDRTYQEQVQLYKGPNHPSKFPLEFHQVRAISRYVQNILEKKDRVLWCEEAEPQIADDGAIPLMDITSIQAIKKKCDDIAGKRDSLVFWETGKRDPFVFWGSNWPQGNSDTLYMSLPGYSLEKNTSRVQEFIAKDLWVVQGITTISRLNLSDTNVMQISPPSGLSQEKIAQAKPLTPLTTIPKALALFRNIEVLNISNRGGTLYKIRNIPDDFVWPQSLKTLNLSGNALEINSKTPFPSLEVLILKGNGLKTVPERLGNMAQLRVLNLSENELSELPPAVALSSSLETLSIAGNPIQEPSSTISKSAGVLHDRGNGLYTI